MRRMFEDADEDGNGFVELHEHLAFFRSMRGQHRMSPQQLTSIFNEADKNPTDGKVSFEGKQQ